MRSIGLRLIVSIAAILLVKACGGGAGSTRAIDAAGSSNPAVPRLLSFSLLAQDNPELDADLEFVITSSTANARLPKPVSVKSLVPSFTIEGSLVTVNGQPQTSNESAQDFTQKLSYSVSNGKGESRSYEIDLNRFTGLPIVYLTTEEPVLSKEDYVGGTFLLDGWRHYESVDQLDAKIRGRGNSTWFLHPKKPYQIKLESKRSLFGMAEDKKWLFLAEYSDKTLLRNRLAFELGHRSTLKWTPSGHFAEVFVNNVHTGVYHVTEKVEDGENRVNIGETGFLLEIDQPDRLDADDVFFRTESYLINIKEPSVDYDDTKFIEVRDHITEFERILLGNDFADPEQGYAAYVDIDSFIDWFLINEIAKNVDAQWYSSIFLHWVPGEKIRMGPIWDFDLGFGNVDYADATYPEGWWVRWNTWISRMLEDPVFVKRVKERYADLDSQRPEIKENLAGWAEELKLSQAENDLIWQTMGRYVWPNPVIYDTYEEEVAYLEGWLDTRMDWMKEALERL